MIKNFGNRAAQDVWEAWASKALSREIWKRAKALLTIMHATNKLDDLRVKGQLNYIHLHKLKGDRKGYWSINIKLLWCITFHFKDGTFSDVKIENYYGAK